MPVERAYRIGLSPRVRGNPLRAATHRVIPRSIPACAGEPYVADGDPLLPLVYPRVCGGTNISGARRRSKRGLSPRVRGNQTAEAVYNTLERSIPACAGEPSHRVPASPAQWVYPRVCGGTHDAAACSSAICGLSPRVRGNLHVQLSSLGSTGSIPACAGEPHHREAEHQPPEVYPRVCGGTICPQTHFSNSNGLSPRVRGNHG